MRPYPLDGPRRPVSDRGLIVLIGCLLMLQPLSTDLYLASLPGLTQAFATDIATVQLTLSVFILGFGVMQLVSGPLSDRFGRRPVVIGGVGLYLAASLACALAPTIGTLVTARFFQAVGCCSAVVGARAIVRDAFTPERGARALARALTVLAIGPIVGPILGSLLEVRFGHRAAFVALATFASALLLVTAARLRESNAHRNSGATRPRDLAANYLHVLRSPEFLVFTLLGTATYGGLFAFISGSSFVMIRILGITTEWFGAAYASVIIGYLAGTLLCQRLIARRGLLPTLAVGGGLAASGGIAMALFALGGAQNWAALLVPQFVYMMSHGINFPCAMYGCVAPFPRHAGAAAGMFGFLTTLAAAGVGAWIGSSHDGTLVPLTLTIAAAGLVSLGTVALGIRKYARAAVPGMMSTTSRPEMR
jgi:DHA1 family bicyclomycin/chloramphenicol resistance-like MFS transporter